MQIAILIIYLKMSIDDDQGMLLCTPRRAQKCLFATSNDKSDKRTIIPSVEQIEDNKESSEDSDLGPMSPLALTDQSPSLSNSSLSSSGREFISPFATPEKSLTYSPSLSWDRLRFNMQEHMSPFTALKMVTKAARYSPRCKLFNDRSSKSLPATPNKNVEPLMPQHLTKIVEQTNEIIPETPQRNFATEIQNQNITETPRKGRTPERQITPSISISKTVPLPKLHKRKFSIEISKDFSPEQKENTLKRHARDQSAGKPTKLAKLFKADDASVPRARASLFQERRNECSSLKNFSLSTKMFYSGNIKSERPFSNFRNSDVKRRRTLPPQSNIKHSSLRKRKYGRINAGVCHGIKKPKPKVNIETLKKKEQQNLAPSTNKSSSMEEALSMKMNTIVEKPLSPMIDETKRFFKTNRTIRLNHAATVTVNNKIKLKVTDGKIILKENQNQKRIPSTKKDHKQKSSPVDVPLDATDLTVDEPEVETLLQQDKVDDLLKILEDDWSNDDYDTMGTLTDTVNAVSPLKSTTTKILSKDMIMSPATELSNMTSTMNIKDAPLKSFQNLSLDNTNNNKKETEKENAKKKYFPLFTKGYSVPDNIFEETNNANTTKATKKSMQWQLSAKGGGAEDQYQLDAGQKHFGATQCQECNVVYQLGNPEDENAHLNYHNSIRILKFQGWKNERVISEDPFTSSRIILIEPHDPKQHWKKVLEILTVVDRDLGLTDMNISEYQNKNIFLYIREKTILGVLVAEHIEKAFRIIPELIELNCCTDESTPTKCGINVVWTAMSHRKQGIATKLVDTLRTKFFYGYVMSMDDIAFSIPTPGGKIFAEKYTKTRSFKNGQLLNQVIRQILEADFSYMIELNVLHPEAM
ncbi:N-acetyltransferase ESCO2 isoform X4 [Pogonomyrmex barbatus]|nr:N-acetyltransferase ESCO2 isoform X4 [Pogonomyrmex barbatus]